MSLPTEKITGRALADWRRLLRCVACKSALSELNGTLQCVSCARKYPERRGIPILLRSDHPLFPSDAYSDAGSAENATVRNGLGWGRFVPALSINLSDDRILGRMSRELKARSAALVLVIGGGRQRESLDIQLNPQGSFTLIYADIDVNADIDIFCDAHEIPFADESIDAVVTTAVLEHVMYPEKVASEISRILRVGGLIYSELPFMQQVHEGAFDFTRYTLSGHRRLLNHYREIEAGMVAGPGTALAWSIEYFMLSFVSTGRIRNIIKGVARLSTFWLKWFDIYLCSRPAAMDGASCTYFYGEKAEGRIPDNAIVASYVGGRPFSHL